MFAPLDRFEGDGSIPLMFSEKVIVSSFPWMKEEISS
jgi:hypothetical protein